jgi:death-on-curing protein
MASIEFLSVDDVLFLHQEQILLYGGDDGLRDRNLLDSAIAQASATFGGEFLHQFPFEMAAAYVFHIVQNHPFVDGNKRAGIVTGLVFLDLNGVDISPPSGSIYEVTMSVAQGDLSKVEVANFFELHSDEVGQ